MILSLPLTSSYLAAANISAALDSRIQPWFAKISIWAASSEVVSAVKAQNKSLPQNLGLLNQLKWAALDLNDPTIVSLRFNAAGKYLRKERSSFISEAFINDAAGNKVAFLEKTTSWNHAGNDKHDIPMTGHPWTGPIISDQSSGVKQVQIAVPVFEEGKPIGSLVVGINIFELANK